MMQQLHRDDCDGKCGDMGGRVRSTPDKVVIRRKTSLLLSPKDDVPWVGV